MKPLYKKIMLISFTLALLIFVLRNCGILPGGQYWWLDIIYLILLAINLIIMIVDLNEYLKKKAKDSSEAKEAKK